VAIIKDIRSVESVASDGIGLKRMLLVIGLISPARASLLEKAARSSVYVNAQENKIPVYVNANDGNLRREGLSR
jgi:hypothetical protein